MKTIAVLAYNMEQYKTHVHRDLIPYMEKAHKIKFIRNNTLNTFTAKGYTIQPALRVDQVRGLYNWQLVKVGEFYKNPDAEEINERWVMDQAKRKEK